MTTTHRPGVCAGIGNRDIPDSSYNKLLEIGNLVSQMGFEINSGGAVGSDSAFRYARVFRPEHATKDSMELASMFHPNWNACSNYAKKLLGRNPLIILNESLADPVQFVICYAKDEKKGGTSHSLSIARHYEIPVFNFYNSSTEEKFYDYIRSAFCTIT